MDIRLMVRDGEASMLKTRRINKECPHCGGNISDVVTMRTMTEPRHVFRGKQCRNCTELYDIKEFI